jgi:hypothetical protein
MVSTQYLLDADPWGHSIKNLIQDLEQVDLNAFKRFERFAKVAVLLDRFYIPQTAAQVPYAPLIQRFFRIQHPQTVIRPSFLPYLLLEHR